MPSIFPFVISTNSLPFDAKSEAEEDLAFYTRGKKVAEFQIWIHATSFYLIMWKERLKQGM